VYKLFERLVRLMPSRVLTVVIFSVSFSAALMAQNPVAPERFQYLRKTIDEYNTTICPFLKDLPFLTLSPESLRIYSPEGGSVKLIIISNRKWMLYCSEKWISSDQGTGGGFNKLIIKVMENPESFERLAKIVIKADNLPEKIVILSQKARHDE
jgi:hypothetical protein